MQGAEQAADIRASGSEQAAGNQRLSGMDEPANTERVGAVPAPPQAADSLTNWPLIILVDDAAVAGDQTSFLWTVFTRFDPAHDIYADSAIHNHHVAYRFPMIIDARMKPGYPDELVPQEDIVQRVRSRWREYFPG